MGVGVTVEVGVAVGVGVLVGVTVEVGVLVSVVLTVGVGLGVGLPLLLLESLLATSKDELLELLKALELELISSKLLELPC